ncbi:MAG: hypothetical protein M5U26_03875 [Planctomycetota bacterium]|nr:hypothetical protein [Planctomycetota bacterium]
MNLTEALVMFAWSSGLVVACGVVLARCADRISDLTGLGRLLVGSILLAGATSLPELTVDVAAARQGAPDLALGGIIGSSLFNILILAVLGLIVRRANLFTRDGEVHTLTATLSIMLTAMAGTALILPRLLNVGHDEYPHLLDADYGTWAILLLYLGGVRMSWQEQKEIAAVAASAPEAAAPEAIPHRGRKLALALLAFSGCAAVILFTGSYVASSADALAELTGLGETFVGTTLIALSTSLPELASTAAALRMGSVDLAMGNIFGSNTFNMILLLPVDMAYSGSIMSAATPTHALTCLFTITVTALVVMGLVYRAKKRVHLIEPDSGAVIVLTVAALYLLYILK